MFRRSQEISERGYGWFQYAPTNLLIYAIRDTHRGLKWGIPAMLLLGGGYIYGIAICTVIISREGPSPLYLLVLLFFWNAMKFIWLGPVSLQRLIIARRQEAKDRRNQEQSTRQDATDDVNYDDAPQVEAAR
jgi:hypothetical protein